MVDLPGGGTPAIPVDIPFCKYKSKGPPTELPAGHAVGAVTQVTTPAALMHSCVRGPKPPAAAGDA